MYAYKIAGLSENANGRVHAVTTGQMDGVTIRSKGVSGLVWDEFLQMLHGKTISKTNKAPTMTRTGKYFYMERDVRATTPFMDERLAA